MPALGDDAPLLCALNHCPHWREQASRENRLDDLGWPNPDIARVLVP